MKVLIHKFQLDDSAIEKAHGDGICSFVMKLPSPLSVLSVQWQEYPDQIGGVIAIWAHADVERRERRRVWVIGTGRVADIKRAFSFLGTTQTSSGLVWHVFVEDYPVEDAAV